MFFYVTLTFWLVTLVFSLSEGQRKLPLLSFGMGTSAIWLVYNNSSQDTIGISILAALAAIVYLGGKVHDLNASR